MLIAHSLSEIRLEKSWVTVGSFDGVHRGHQTLLSRVMQGAHEAGCPAVVVTFHPHPREVLNGRKHAFYLTLPTERTALLGEIGIDAVVILEFNATLASMSAGEFVHALKKHLGMEKLFVGRNFVLGNQREGNVHYLNELGIELAFQVVEVEPIEDGFVVISSSHIRNAVLSGNVTYAAQLLGRPYQICGQVEAGDQRGRRLGIPTANIRAPREKLIPAPGVYACRALVNEERYASAVNIGVRPTFVESQSGVYIEAHLLDYSGNLYGSDVTLQFMGRLRDEMKFDSVEALLGQVQRDIQRTREMIHL
jgi:riboflavin kinase/FMN adenylyltransferase